MEAMKKGMQITIKQSPWQHISLQNQKQTSKRNKAKNSKKTHPPAYCDIKEKAITRNECVFRMTSFIPKENGPQPAHKENTQLLTSSVILALHFTAMINE